MDGAGWGLSNQSFTSLLVKPQEAGTFRGYAAEVMQGVKALYATRASRVAAAASRLNKTMICVLAKLCPTPNIKPLLLSAHRESVAYTISRDLRGPVSRVICVMDTLLDIFVLGEGEAQHASRVSELFCGLYVRTLELWSPQQVKIKAHLAHHIGPQLRHFGSSAPCFSTERRNQLLKNHYDSLRRLPGTSRHATARWLAEVLHWFSEGDIGLTRPLAACGRGDDLIVHFRRASVQMRCWAPRLGSVCCLER